MSITKYTKYMSTLSTESPTRKLASVQRIAEIKAIPNADRICAYRINGWWVIDSIGKYQVGDLVVYIEADSWVSSEIAPFLSKGKEPKIYKGIQGEKLRTIKLKNQISQGLLLPLGEILKVVSSEGDDVTQYFGIIKWEAPEEFLPANAKGTFPSFLVKTEPVRAQNIPADIAKYAQDQVVFERTEKIHGTSVTIFVNEGTSGVCSRNLELKEEDNTYWNIEKQYRVISRIKATGRNLAVQGEIYGSSISGNMYQLANQWLAVFDIYDIDKQCYLLPEARLELTRKLGLPEVPFRGYVTLVGTVSALLEEAEGASLINPECIREGFVFKAITDNDARFKVVSNTFLISRG